MPRSVALLTLIAYFFSALPVCAHRRFQRASLPEIPPIADAVADACDLNSRFIDLHTAITGLAQEARDTGITARDLHHTSQSHAYRLVEQGWVDVSTRSGPILDVLAHIPATLDSSPNNAKKKAGLALTDAYQDTLHKILDYTHRAENYQRWENSFARSPRQKMLYNFGKSTMPIRAFSDITALRELEGKYTEVGDALRSLKLPEYQYAKRCHAPLTNVEPASIADPCELKVSLREMSTEIDNLGKKAIAMGHDTPNLRGQTRWRPYKRIETAWADIRTPAEPDLDKLSDMPLALDATPENPKKQASLDLIAGYQNALEKIVDYATFAVYDERVENQQMPSKSPLLVMFSFNILSGINNTQVNQRNLGRSLLEGQRSSVPDALRALALPQHRFAKLCGMTFPTQSLDGASIAPVKNPCTLTGRFLTLHDTITKMAFSAQQAGDKAERLHATSLIPRYKKIEAAWVDVYTRQGSALNALSNIPLALEETRDGKQKAAALALSVSYQNAVERIVDYAHAAHYYMMTQNALSWNFTPGTPRFGIPNNSVRMGGDNVANNLLEARVSEVPNALRSLKFPEYTYSKICHVPHLTSSPLALAK